MSLKCLMNGLEVNYPCSPTCALFGDCCTAFEAQKKLRVVTNANHIRSMTDEELAMHIVNTTRACGMCPAFKSCEIKYPNFSDCMNAVADWLKQPYKED